MLIQDSNVQFNHQHQKRAQQLEQQRLFAVTQEGEERVLASTTQLASRSQQSTVNISERANALVDTAAQSSLSSDTRMPETASNSEQENESLDAKLSQLKVLVESFTGKEIQLAQSKMDTAPDNIAPPAPSQNAELTFEFSQRYEEFESSSLSAHGQITFANGDTLALDFHSYSERFFYTQDSLIVALGNVELTDPLTLNLDGGSASLTNSKVAFDLDSDGKKEHMYFATGRSGFLALDKNENDKIDDGSELFGPKSGNGFAELAVYDEDGNNFIDSGDSVFKHLSFYQKHHNGEDTLTSLSDLNIGALYLGHTASPFELKDAQNQLQGVVRNSGFFVYNNHQVGSMQHIDLAV